MSEDAIERGVFPDQVVYVSCAAAARRWLLFVLANGVLERLAQSGQPIGVYSVRRHDIAPAVKRVFLCGGQRCFSDAAFSEDIFNSGWRSRSYHNRYSYLKASIGSSPAALRAG